MEDLPLAIAFASRGLKVCIYDINEKAVATVLRGELPFREVGAQEMMHQGLEDKNLSASTDERVIGDASHVVVVIGTPVDEHLNPDPHAVPRALHAGHDYLRPASSSSCGARSIPASRSASRRCWPTGG